MRPAILLRQTRRGLGEILDLFSERRCLACDALIGHARLALCRPCVRALLAERLSAGLDVPAPAACAESLPGLAGVWAAANYASPLRELLLQFKHHGRFAVLPLLASLFCQRFRRLRGQFAPDLIVPVPRAFLRYLYRGTDLPACLAQALHERFHVAIVRGLARPVFAAPQTRKTKDERLKLTPRAFRARHVRRLKGKVVLLVDDVLTTGATVLAAARVLLGAGAARVGILALAHGR